MSGFLGSASGPIAGTKTRALNAPWSVSTFQRAVSSSQSAEVTVWPKRTESSTPWRRAVSRR